MGTTILTCSSTITDTGWSINGGAGSIWASLADDSDATYITQNAATAEWAECGFTQTVPKGVTIVDLTLYGRESNTTFGRGSLRIVVGGTGSSIGSFNNGAATAVSATWATNPITSVSWKWYEFNNLGPVANQLDSIGVYKNNTASVPRAVNWFKLYAVVTWVGAKRVFIF